MQKEYRFGTVSIFIKPAKDQIEKLNNILSEHAEMILGRMGLPNPQQKINIICLIVYGDTDQMGALTGKLGLLPGIQVKSCFYRSKIN
ncbi:MAG: iron-only hydrogenase system regulator [Candidatus Caldatribacteriota bacterium]